MALRLWPGDRWHALGLGAVCLASAIGRFDDADRPQLECRHAASPGRIRHSSRPALAAGDRVDRGWRHLRVVHAQGRTSRLRGPRGGRWRTSKAN